MAIAKWPAASLSRPRHSPSTLALARLPGLEARGAASLIGPCAGTRPSGSGWSSGQWPGAEAAGKPERTGRECQCCCCSLGLAQQQQQQHHCTLSSLSGGPPLCSSLPPTPLLQTLLSPSSTLLFASPISLPALRPPKHSSPSPSSSPLPSTPHPTNSASSLFSRRISSRTLAHPWPLCPVSSHLL